MRYLVINFDVDVCIFCMICVCECLVWCIIIDVYYEVVLDCDVCCFCMVVVFDEFVIDWGLCMYCGMCIEFCLFDVLFWSDKCVLELLLCIDLVSVWGLDGDW